MTRWVYVCEHTTCEYYHQRIIQAIAPGIFPSCKACGRTLRYLFDEPTQDNTAQQHTADDEVP